MATKIKKKNKRSIKYKGTLEEFVNRDFSNEPFFIRKDEQARKMIEKYGLPKEWIEDQKK